MRMSGKLALCAALVATASACGQDDADNQVTAAENAQPAANEAMMNDPNNPYAQAEMGMHDRMMAVRGATPSETWIRKMIEHHQGAIDMANVLIAQGGDPEVLALARRTIEAQTREIAELRAMLGADRAEATPAPTVGAAERDAAPTNRPAAARPATAPAAPRPRPEPAPKEEPADPHAGHNMANMSRD